MKIIYKSHVLIRLKERKIPKDYPQKILKDPENEYFDTISKHFISIKILEYGKKLRNMVVTYDIINNIREVITCFPISNNELRNKIKSDRWKIYEKN